VSDVTRILEAVNKAIQSREELLPLVYEELRRLATHRMANEAAAIHYTHRTCSRSLVAIGRTETRNGTVAPTSLAPPPSNAPDSH